MNYEEALELALNWKAITGQPMADEIIEALKYAQKEHELLGLYRRFLELDNVIHITFQRQYPSYIDKCKVEMNELHKTIAEKELEEMK